MLLPIGTGELRKLQATGIHYQAGVNWLPDGERVLCNGDEPRHGVRIYLQSIDGASARPITPEGVSFPFGTHPLSPDGTLVAVVGPHGQGRLYPLQEGAPRLIPGFVPGDTPTQWDASGRSLYVFRRGELPTKVYRVDLSTGHRELWKEVMPPDPAGITQISRVLLTPNGGSYVYSYVRILSELYLVEGLR